MPNLMEDLSQPPTKAPVRAPRTGPNLRLVALLALLLIAAGVAVGVYRHFQDRVSSDDANVDGHISAIAPKIAGNVAHRRDRDRQGADAIQQDIGDARVRGVNRSFIEDLAACRNANDDVHGFSEAEVYRHCEQTYRRDGCFARSTAYECANFRRGTEMPDVHVITVAEWSPIWRSGRAEPGRGQRRDDRRAGDRRRFGAVR